MIRYGKTNRDRNQGEIIARYEALHCSVRDAAGMGEGFPDLVVGVAGFTDLVEIKNPDGKNSITAVQADFIHNWRGTRPIVVWSVSDVDEHVARRREQAKHGQVFR